VKIFSLSDVSSKEKELLSYRQQLEKLSENTPIAKIIDCFIENRELFLVREYIRGSSYDCQIKENKSLNTEVIINFLEQVLQILDSLHQKGFIHGNLKPANTIFSEEGKCILTDLGIGSAINFPCAHRNWPLGNDYIPIEQKSTPLSVLDDLYAIGIMGTQALTGMNSYDIPLAVQTSGIVPRSRDIAERNLSKILEKLLKKRYRDAQEVLKDLRKVKRQSILMVLQPWNKYILATILGGLSFVFINYLWLQYQAIVLFERGDIRLESKDYPEALKSYNQGISKVKGKVGFFERAWIGKAMALSNLKQYSEMKEVCQEVIRAKQESPYGWNCLGLAFFGLEQYNEAMEAYNKALKDNPEFLEALNNRGYAYQKLNRYNDAIADFQKAIELDAQHTISYVTYNNLGNLYYQQKEYQLALKAYQTSIEINNNYLSSWLGLGNVQRQIQQDKEAKYSYTKAVKIDRKSYEAWYLKGLVEEKLAEYTEALESYKAAIEIKEDYQSAIEAKNRLLSKYPKN
jgi:tetratricopeptide (TPR) repeat protein